MAALEPGLSRRLSAEPVVSYLQAVSDARSGGLDLAPLAGCIGAEVRGIRLSGSLGPDVLRALRRELHRHRVLLVRGQHQLDDARQQAFGALWGAPAPCVDGAAAPSGGPARGWHSDFSFRAAAPSVSIVRVLESPLLGGDTLWANAVAAYEELPAELKAFAERLRALHESDGRAAEHPVVRVHPETGERALLLGRYARRLVGYPDGDSQRLLELLQGRVERPENTLRWRWTPGDVAIWDCRATQHCWIEDCGGRQRVLRRVTVGGEAAVGVDGRRSVERRAAAAQGTD